jgi:hypothetical protein
MFAPVTTRARARHSASGVGRSSRPRFKRRGFTVAKGQPAGALKSIPLRPRTKAAHPAVTFSLAKGYGKQPCRYSVVIDKGDDIPPAASAGPALRAIEIFSTSHRASALIRPANPLCVTGGPRTTAIGDDDPSQWGDRFGTSPADNGARRQGRC